MVHREALRLKGNEEQPRSNIARHFFDIHFLLQHAEVIEFLNDGKRVQEVLVDIQAVTDRFFAAQGSRETRPSAGFANSPAFDDSSDSWLRLRDSYYSTMQELSFDNELPEWNLICGQVQRHAALL